MARCRCVDRARLSAASSGGAASARASHPRARHPSPPSLGATLPSPRRRTTRAVSRRNAVLTDTPAATRRVGTSHARLSRVLRAARRSTRTRLPGHAARMARAQMIKLDADVIIVGSGAGGGTVARALAPLARDGMRVLLLEQGPRLDDHEFTGRELERADALYEDGGGFLTADGTMTLAFGRAYGGSTVVYTGTSLVAPERVIRRWGVPGIEYSDIARRSEKFMEQNNVHLLSPEEINENNRRFVEGCAAAGYRAEQFPVNIKGCMGSSLCNLGCPNAAKQGTHRVQLPNAERNGVEVVTRAEALRIEERAVVVRVSERRAGEKGLPSEWAPGDYRVRASVVVVSGGAVGSPALMLRSQLPARLPRLGEGFTCHPAHILVAEHDRAITNDVGFPKSYYLD